MKGEKTEKTEKNIDSDKKADVTKLKEKLIAGDSKKAKKTEPKAKEKEIKIPDINSFKTHSFAQTTNKLLTKYISDEAGDCFFGENLERTMEYYGLKATPGIALIPPTLIVSFEGGKKIYNSIFKKRKNGIPK